MFVSMLANVQLVVMYMYRPQGWTDLSLERFSNLAVQEGQEHGRLTINLLFGSPVASPSEVMSKGTHIVSRHLHIVAGDGHE